MALDGLFLNRINHKLSIQTPLKIQRIYHVSENELVFIVRNHDAKMQLLLSAHSVHNRLQFSNQNFVYPQEPSNFVMLLRKHLEDGLILNIQQIGLDRVVEFKIQKRNELGDLHHYRLMIELMGKYANVVFVDDQDRVIDALKRIPPYENTKRTIHPGAAYNYPEQSDRKNPFTNVYDPTISLMDQFHGFSPLLAREVDHRLKQGESFASIIRQIEHSELWFVSDEKASDYHCIELRHLNQSFTQYPLMDGLDHVYQALEEKERIKQHSGDLIKFINRELKKAKQKRPKLLEAMDDALDCEKWRTYGDYLYAYGMQVPKGLKLFETKDFETDEIILIPLDDKYDGKQNAQRYYQKYNKGKKGQVHITHQLELNQNEIDYFTSLSEQIELASVNDAIEIREELVREGYLKQKHATKRKKEVKLNIIQLHFGDARIYVGKNNLQNEQITFKIGQKKDLWFHASAYHGSHVLLQNSEDKDLIELAASFAAYFSKARGTAKVEVQMVQIKDLKKIPDAKPGMVNINNYSTLMIEPNEAELLQIIKDHQVK